MKTILFAVVLCAAGTASAAPGSIISQADSAVSMKSVTSMFETKGRTGSKRVGGTGRSGKGGRYVGGHK